MKNTSFLAEIWRVIIVVKKYTHILMLFLLIALLSACGAENGAGKNAIEISENPVVSPTGDDSTADMNKSANETFDIPSIFDEDPFLQAKDAASRPYAKPSDPKEIDSGCKQEIETLIKAFFDAYNSSLNARSDADLSVFYDLSTNNRVWDFRLNQAVLYTEILNLISIEAQSIETQSELLDVVVDASNWSNGDGYIVAFPRERIEQRSNVDTITNTIEHEFVLVKNGDEMRIIRHRIYCISFAASQNLLIKHCRDIDDMDAIKKLLAEL